MFLGPLMSEFFRLARFRSGGTAKLRRNRALVLSALGLVGGFALPMAAQSSYNISSLAPSSGVAGQDGATIQLMGTFPSFSGGSYGVCFYTGNSDSQFLAPTDVSSGTATVTVPATLLQSVLPSAFSGGAAAIPVFLAPSSDSACSLSGAVSNIEDFYLGEPAIYQASFSGLSQVNPAVTGTANPTQVQISGYNFLSNPASQAQFTYGSNTAVAAVTTYLDSYDLLSPVPSPPSGATSGSLSVCTVVNSLSYCSPPDDTLTFPVVALSTATGTLTAPASTVPADQTVPLTAQFAPTGSNAATGAPSGLVTFADGTNTLATLPLQLDVATATFQQAAPFAFYDYSSDAIQRRNAVPGRASGRAGAAQGAAPRTQPRPSRVAPRDAPYGTVSGFTPFITDVNRDGIPDVLILDPANGAIHVLLGSVPRGTYLQMEDIDVPGSCVNLASAAVGDLNHDGYPDVAFTCETNVNTNTYHLYTAINSPQLSFTLTELGAVDGVEIAIGDVNKDGFPDVVVSGSNDGWGTGFSVYLGNGSGTSFSVGPVTTSSLGGGTQMKLVDFDQDGYPDLAIFNASDSSFPIGVNILRNNQSGYFDSSATSVPTSSTATYSLGALQGNYPSVLIVDTAGAQVGISANPANGSFVAGTPTYVPVVNLQSAAWGDFNGDGWLDAATFDGSAINVLTGNGTGGLTATTFSTAETLASSLAGGTLLAGVDENVDGYADALFFSPPSTSGSLGTLTNYLVSGTASATDTAGPFSSGTHSLSASIAGTPTLLGATATKTITTNAVTPTLTWATPCAITYGTPLSATQLNAVALDPNTQQEIPGSFTYTPAAGTVLSAGADTLSVVFVPIATGTYTNANGQVSLHVNQVTPTVTWTTPAPVIYGTALSGTQLDASSSVAGTFQYTPAGGTVLSAGAQNLSALFTPTDQVDYSTVPANVSLLVQRATPQLVWTSPANAVVGTPLSAAQLNTTASGVNGQALPGVFVYTPPAGTLVQSGLQTLSVVFTPTDAVDYVTASASVPLTGTPLTLSSVSPSTAQLGDPAKTITLTGTGFLNSSVVQVNGIAIATTFVSGTTLTAVIPGSLFLVAQSLSITVADPMQSALSAALTIEVSAPPVAVSFSGPSSAQSGQQLSVDLKLANPYPVVLSGIVTLTFTPDAGFPDDPSIQFSQGGRTLGFQIPAETIVTPTVQFQAGTVAGMVALTLDLQAGGIDVTPSSIQKISIALPTASPGISSVTFTQTGSTVTVSVVGFSNTLQVTQANFHFTAAGGASLNDPDISVPVTQLFSGWFGSSASSAYGSEFTYTQSFTLSESATIEKVTVTLVNAVGQSEVGSSP